MMDFIHVSLKHLYSKTKLCLNSTLNWPPLPKIKMFLKGIYKAFQTLNPARQELFCLSSLCQNEEPLFTYLTAVLLGSSDNVLARVDPVKLLLQWIIVDCPNISEAVYRKDDLWTLQPIDHHTVDCVLLTKQQETCRGLWRNARREGKGSVRLKMLRS